MIAFVPEHKSASGLLGSPFPLSTTAESRVARLRAMSLRGLRRMYDPSRQTFVFRLRKTREGVVPEGFSVRYTAISLIGLSTAGRDEVASVLGSSGDAVYASLAAAACASTNVGDVALTLWAGDLF